MQILTENKISFVGILCANESVICSVGDAVIRLTVSWLEGQQVS